MKRLIPQFGDGCLESRGDAFTTLARSMMGIISPYMKPVWCAIGEAISTTSSAPSAIRCAYGMMFDISVLAVCITPLGSPAVPEV